MLFDVVAQQVGCALAPGVCVLLIAVGIALRRAPFVELKNDKNVPKRSTHALVGPTR